jgi:hypothetical protein
MFTFSQKNLIKIGHIGHLVLDVYASNLDRASG